jgi:hypothetical protein
VRDLRQKGVDAFPSPISLWASDSTPDNLLKPALKIDGAELLPLGGVANKLTVLCNETGQYVTYESDEHGFNNPQGIWSVSPVDVAAVGDSFTQGQCVASDKNLVAWIRSRYPATINLGMAGIGPLLTLAAIQEYLTTLRPKVVLWVHFEGNDFIDLRLENNSPLLMRYLEENYSQGLLARQAKIDQAIADSVGIIVAGRGSTTGASQTYRQEAVDLLALQHVRLMVYAALRLSPGGPSEAEYDLFKRILNRADLTVSSWGGKLYFVYLPSADRYYDNSSSQNSFGYELTRQRVFAIMEELKIPTIDVNRAFVAQGDPREMFFYKGSHYNFEGYRVAAQAVLDSIKLTN